MSKETFDIAIIGAGVVGAAIARKLSSCNLKTALLEKEYDVSLQMMCPGYLTLKNSK